MGSVCVSSIPALAAVDTFLSRVKNASAVIRHRFYIVENEKLFEEIPLPRTTKPFRSSPLIR
jgi:hypothetical protein